MRLILLPSRIAVRHAPTSFPMPWDPHGMRYILAVSGRLAVKSEFCIPVKTLANWREAIQMLHIGAGMGTMQPHETTSPVKIAGRF
jgi:hypothetical protein